MTEPTVISRWDLEGDAYIEQLQPGDPRGELFYRSCARGICRYSSDLWQAEIYAQQLIGRPA